MARSIRIEYPGAFYHVMARGNRREAIFLDEEDRRFFLKAVGEACAMTGWRVHAWVLMSNHYHLVIETPQANLVAGMQWLQNTFTRRFNVRHRQWGRLFGDRYKAVLVEGGGGYYYQTLLDYVHLNPVRAGLVRPNSGGSVLDYPWSSVAGGYALRPGQRPRWLAAAEGLGAFDLPDNTSGRRRFVGRLDRLAVEDGARRAGIPLTDAEVDARCSHLRRGWYWGTQRFAEKMLALAKRPLGKPKGRAYRSGGLRRSHDEHQAEEWLQSGLVASGLREADLGGLAGSDARKVALARLLWRGTTVSQGWIATRLRMGSAANVSQQLRRGIARGEKSLPMALRRYLREHDVKS
jgi:REP element-mobilizing transposase RayT